MLARQIGDSVTVFLKLLDGGLQLVVWEICGHLLKDFLV